jgi:hypothetical protein
MRKKRNAYRVLVGKPEGNIQHGTPKSRLVDTTKTEVEETRWEDVGFTNLAQDRDKWRALVKTEMKWEILCVADKVLALKVR